MDLNTSIALSRSDLEPSSSVAFVPASRIPVGGTAAFVEFTDFDQGYAAVLDETFASFEELEC